MTNEDILYALYEAENYISGEQLSKRLGVSRAAVWKAIQALREDGYVIHSVTNRGYHLVSAPDRLHAAAIGSLLKNKSHQLFLEESVSSTNTLALFRAQQGGTIGSVFLSEGQTMGKGIANGGFLSPLYSGVFLSIIVQPKLAQQKNSADSAPILKAVQSAIDHTYHVKTDIFLPNQLHIHGKKICGILTEGAYEAESGIVNCAVLGIGVHVNRTQQQEPGCSSIEEETGECGKRCTLAAEIINCLDAAGITK